ncbi:MAG: hypothetical protein PHF37_09815 [Phycisphaerae bacterium]|nr:hypothetical protein [Phycisphaerae bacterium]
MFMDSGGLYDIVEKIFFGVSFMAIGGTLAMVFFFIFAPSIMGVKSISKQLEGLQKQLEELNKRFGRSEGSKESDSEGQAGQ